VQLAITELVPCAKEHLFTYRTLKEGVLPRVRAQCTAPAPAQPLPLRVNALIGLSQVCYDYPLSLLCLLFHPSSNWTHVIISLIVIHII
jgi:hypothetical protein